MNLKLFLSGASLILGIVFLGGHVLQPIGGDDGSTGSEPSHRHVHGANCIDCQGQAIRTWTLKTGAGDRWFEAKVGDQVKLGFELGGSRGGELVMRESLPDGRETLAIKLTSGHDFFVVRTGAKWEGRAMSVAGGNGWRVRSANGQLEFQELEFGSMICGDGGVEVAGLPPIQGTLPEDEESDFEVAEVLAPTLSSLPDANGVIYLDFDGETVTGTQWNSSYNSGNPIVAAPSGFSDSKIQTVWKGVSEDYRPFNVNVTTDRAVFDSYPVNRRAMLVFTPSNEWYGRSGGVAYVNVYGSSSFDAPGWVFVDQLSNSAAYSSEAASHEAGHILGLRHDGTSSLGYYEGHNRNTATSWAPIMGIGYYSNVTQWSKGEYAGANNSEDDLEIISKTYNGLGYRSDDHGDSTGGATSMTEVDSEQLSASGVIGRNTDLDYLSFQTSGGGVAFSASNNGYDPNLDIRLTLLDSSGEEVADSNPSGNLDASISATVPAGEYFLKIQGTGNASPSPGYGDYGSLGSYSISGTAPRGTILVADIISPSVESLSISEGACLILDGLVSGGSPSWDLVSAPAGGGVDFSSPVSHSTEATFTGSGSYILRLNSNGGSEVVSDEITVVVEESGSLSSNTLNLNLGSDRLVYSNEVALEPEVSAGDSASVAGYEWSTSSGSGQLSSVDVAQPDLFFPTAGATDLRLVVDFGVAKLFQEVSYTASFAGLQLLTSGSIGKTFSPSDGDLGDSWRQVSFDDSSWQTGFLGVGYEVLNGASTPMYADLIGPGLDVQSAMYQKTGGCYIRSTFDIQDASTLLSLTLSVYFDDGFVAYLNGMEIARSNAPAGSPDWDSLAPTDRLDSAALTPSLFPIALAPGLVVSGTNVLAIHGMNSAVSTGEREFLLVPQVEAIVALTPYSITMDSISDPELAAPTADADGDGLANLFEHAAGSSPTSEDDPFRLVNLLGEETAALILPVTPPDDVRYTLLHALDPGGDWDEVAVRTGSSDWSGSPVIEVKALSNGRERTCFALPPGERGFLRLKLELVIP